MSTFRNLLLAAAVAASTPAWAQPRLSIVDLRSLTTAPAAATGDINNAGVAIGTQFFDSGQFRPFVYSAATGLQDFGTLVGAAASDSISLFDINNRGQMVGEWNNRPFVYAASGGVQFIGTDPGTALRINEAGQVALMRGGSSFLYTPGAGETALPLSFGAGGVAVNDSGATMGYVGVNPPPTVVNHAARNDTNGLQDLGTLGGANSYANDMNNAGTVVGYSETTADFMLRPFRYSDTGGLEALQVGSFAIATTHVVANTIDDRGLITGNFFADDLNSPPSAFLYHDSFGMLDANSLLDPADAATWHLQGIGRFNSEGYASVYALVDGTPRAALLRLSAPVPEPEAWLMALVALPLCWRVAKARRRPTA